MHEIPQQTGRVTELIYTYHTIALAAGFILDLIFGDPRWLYHPVCLIGKLISSFEKGIRKVFPKTEKGELAGGLVEVILIIFRPWVCFWKPFGAISCLLPDHCVMRA